MRPPKIIYICSGKMYVINALWSIASLKRYGYENLLLLVGDEQERQLVAKHHPDLDCQIQGADRKGYPAFSYKPFALWEFLKRDALAAPEEIVICDADVLWLRDPAPLFERFQGRHWFHKITAVESADYQMSWEEIPPDNIGLKTSFHYQKLFSPQVLPFYRLNAGLFKVPTVGELKNVLDAWMARMLEMRPNQMLMSEAVLSHVYAEREIVPASDDVKYDGKFNASGLAPYEATVPPTGQVTGYQTARHFFSSQQLQMTKMVREEGLDPFGLLPEYLRLFAGRKISRVWKRIGQIWTRPS